MLPRNHSSSALSLMLLRWRNFHLGPYNDVRVFGGRCAFRTWAHQSHADRSGETGQPAASLCCMPRLRRSPRISLEEIGCPLSVSYVISVDDCLSGQVF